MSETLSLKENIISQFSSKKTHDTSFESISIECVFILEGLLPATVLVWIAQYENGYYVSWTTATERHG